MVRKLKCFAIKEFLWQTLNNACLAVINLDSALNKDGHYYPQAFLKVCKYIKKKVIRHINGNLSHFSSDDDSDDSVEEQFFL